MRIWILGLMLVVSVAYGQDKVVPESKQQLEFSYAPVVKKVAPAVVNIYATRVVRSQHISPLRNDPIYRHFFGEDFFMGGSPTRIQRSLGSGVIVSPNGIVITNNHVIRNAEAIKVVLLDKREFEAEVVAIDKRTDLAALRIKDSSGELPYLKLRDADGLEVGDVVLAIGNPFGLGQTVTSGIVSALARTQVGVSDFRSFIQTDAAINPGNSGGALVTLDGRLVGINSAILSKSGGSIGIGFATPSNLVVPVIESVNRGGKIIRPWFGAAVQNLTAELASGMDRERIAGVLVTGIYPGGPADRAGLKVGDLIVEVDDQEVADSSGFQFRIATRKIGRRTIFKIVRAGQESNIHATLEAPPKEDAKGPVILRGRHPLAGVTVANLSPARATELGIDFMERGVIVLKITRGTIANRIGLLPGDIIKSLNDAEVKSINDLARRLIRVREGWKLIIKRGSEVYTIKLRS